jgi:opacity protein-like surface antigen
MLAVAMAAPASAQGLYDDFEGFYAGILVGGVTAHVAGHYEGVAPPPPAVVAYDFTLSPSGIAITGVAGYEHPWQQFVFRLEGDVSAVLGASSTYVHPSGRDDSVAIGATAHIRGIAGMPVGQFVPFVAAGVGVAAVQASHTGPALVGPGMQTWTQNALYIGPSVGAGADIVLENGMRVRLEVLADFFASRHFDWTGDNSRWSDIGMAVLTARGGVTIPF